VFSNHGEAYGENPIFLPAIFGLNSPVLIPAGTFQMGCDILHNGPFECKPDELPLHTVFLDSYYIDAAEVTNGRYAECVDAGVCTPPEDFSSNSRPSYYDHPWFVDYPVIWVDWNQADQFCAWAGGRLPTEAEWEKAARGPSDTRAFPWGDDYPTCELVNSRILNSNCVGDTTAGGSFSTAGDSPYRLQDMAGNVYEWVNDWYSQTYYQNSPGINPQGPAAGQLKIRRAGAYGSTESFVRVAVRIPTPIETTRNYIGFRCAYDP
jgi:formylglycine-generating enzyme required for sulfatase activity